MVGGATGGVGVTLLLGPLLRYTDETRAVVWVETAAPARVEVLGRSTETVEVEGHHYGYLVVAGLQPGTDTPYDVRLNGRRVWPADDDPRPAPRIRTPRPGDPVDLVFGSCRMDRPHTLPYELEPEQHPRGVGVDALQALALAIQRGERPLPDLLLMLGDQVYADEEMSPRFREQQRARRGDSDPRDEIADFEEYTWLYRDAWTDADVRWLLATVPSGMVFDDHDVRDDWNISDAWQRKIRALPWWRERIVGAYMSYWLYQHLGNLAPEQVEREGLLAALRAGRGEALRRFAEQADDEAPQDVASRWSWSRSLGGSRLVVLDIRTSRVLEPGRRALLSEPEWRHLEPALRGDCDHLLVATSLPLLLARPLHDLERWNEAVCDGGWGPRAARLAEGLRQATDLEHWAAFSRSFIRLTGRLGDVARGRLGAPPATVLVLSGDVHHSYVAPLRFLDGPRPLQPVVQLVSSPLRNAFPRTLQRGFGFAHSALATGVGRVLARLARAPDAPVSWSVDAGPWFSNSLSTLRLSGRTAELRVDRATRRDGRPVLEPLHRERVDLREP